MQAIANVSGGVSIVDAVTGKARCVATVAADPWVFAVSLSPDGSRVAWGTVDGRTVVSSAVDGTMLWTSSKSTRAIGDVTWKRDGSIVASACWDGHVREYDSQTGTVTRDFAGDGGTSAMSVDYSSDSSRLLTSSSSGHVAVWNVGTGAVERQLRICDPYPWTARWSPAATWIGVVAKDGIAYLLRSDGSTPMKVLHGHEGDACAIAFAADESYIVTGGSDGTIRRWSIPDGDCMDVWRPPLPVESASHWDQAFLALCRFRLGQTDSARALLALAQANKDGDADAEFWAVLREAETELAK